MVSCNTYSRRIIQEVPLSVIPAHPISNETFHHFLSLETEEVFQMRTAYSKRGNTESFLLSLILRTIHHSTITFYLETEKGMQAEL